MMVGQFSEGVFFKSPYAVFSRSRYLLVVRQLRYPSKARMSSLTRPLLRASGPFADSNVASHNAGITPETLLKKHAGPVSVRFKYTIQTSNYIPALP